MTFMSITTRVTRTFVNPFGESAYSTPRKDIFLNFEIIGGGGLAENAVGFPPRVRRAVSAWEEFVEREGRS